MSTYWIAAYRQGSAEPEWREQQVPLSDYDNDPWLADRFTDAVADWSPQHRVELQADSGGWTETLTKATGTLPCGHGRRFLGSCIGAPWCSGRAA